MVGKIEAYPDGKFWCGRGTGTDFFNVYRTQILDELRERFGGLHKLTGSHLDAKRLREAFDLTHSQVQTLLASIGRIKGYAVRVPENDG